MDKKKKKFSWKTVLGIGVFYLICGFIGFYIGKYTDSVLPEHATSGEKIFFIAWMLLCALAGVYLQLVIHEGGHLVFGLLTGYRFSSFRVGNVMLLKENGRLVFRKYSLAGTGGQCLMEPPEMVDGKFPVLLYNLGGPLMNVLASAVFAGVYYLIPTGTLVSGFCLVTAVVGIYLAAINGIPMRLSGLDNDGKNAISLGKDPGAMMAFWIQMKVLEQMGKGVRLKDMPEEWFEVPSDEAMRNPMAAARAVFACNRLMDGHRFPEAEELTDWILDMESGISGVHRNMLTCDRIYLELIGQRRGEVVDALYTRELTQFMKAMKTSPTVIRTEYVYWLLDGNDPQKAQQCLERFEKVAKTYPYPVDVQSERELMEIAEKARVAK